MNFAVFALILLFSQRIDARVMPWLCLERCGASEAEVKAQIEQVAANRALFGTVSIEHFDIGNRSSLVRAANMTDAGPALVGAGVAVLPMVSSYPYAAWIIDAMRAVFADPGPFIAQCVEEAARAGYAGFNIDWEPQNGEPPSASDAAAYARFLDQFAHAMHTHGLLATVDVATWSPVWNISAIAGTAVDGVVLMSTYTDSDPTWYRVLNETLAAFGDGKGVQDRLWVGLETLRHDGTAYPLSQVSDRLQHLRAIGIKNVALWKGPVPESWFPLLQPFA